MTCLARALKKRGHDVIFFTSFMSEPFVRAAGLEAIPFREKYIRPDNVGAKLAHLSTLQGDEALRYAFELLADYSRELIEDGHRIITESNVDTLVLDSLWSNLDLVAMHVGIPYVHVSLALHPDFTGHTPFWAFDWPHEDGAAARSRNLKGLSELASLAAPCHAVTQEFVRRVGLNIDVTDPYASFSRLAQITQTPREFDFPSNHWPSHFHHTGPLHDEEGRISIPFPWEKLTGEPLIYASMGTLNNGSEWVYRAIIEAASQPGRQLVLSVGNNVDVQQLGPVASNMIIVSQAPQVQVLQKATLCITHAGQNTVLESLAQAVPVVAIPVANDQPGVAARVAQTNTGKFIRFAEVSAPKLRALVDEVIAEPVYRDNAARMSRIIRNLDGPQLAADIVERAFGVGYSGATFA